MPEIRVSVGPKTPSLYPLKKFSATYTWGGESKYYLIEAQDRQEAERILDEELGPNRLQKGTEQVEWSTHETAEWRSAWRHSKVEALRPTRLPDGIQ